MKKTSNEQPCGDMIAGVALQPVKPAAKPKRAAKKGKKPKPHEVRLSDDGRAFVKHPDGSYVPLDGVAENVRAGQRWLVKQSKAPWQQAGDVAFKVLSASPLSDAELEDHGFDALTLDAVKGVPYALLMAEGLEPICVPCDMLEEIGVKL